MRLHKSEPNNRQNDAHFRSRIERFVLRHSHAKRNKEIYLAKQEGRTIGEISWKYDLSKSYISLICRAYSIYLEDNAMPSFDDSMPADSVTDEHTSLKEDARAAFQEMGIDSFYQNYDIILALDTSVRAKNAMINMGITTLGKIDQHSDAYLLRMPNFGKKSLKELRCAVAEMKAEFGINKSNFETMTKAQKKMKALILDLGEERAVEIFDIAAKAVRDENEMLSDLSEIIRTICPEETPFMGNSNGGIINYYEWDTK
jgi:hypothetical protein